MTTQDLTRQSKLHARTLAVLNHCVGTARRDAAAEQLFRFTERVLPIGDQGTRRVDYEKCLLLIRDILTATQRSSPILYNPRLALADKPVIHFLRLLRQLFQTVHSVASHIEAVQTETQLLNEHLGEEGFETLLGTCQDFANYEVHAWNAIRKIAPVGQLLLQNNSRKRQDAFTPQENLRYQKAYAEYTRHYSELCKS